MKEFLMENWLTLLGALLFVGYIVYLSITRQWMKLRGLAYALMLQAERAYTDNDGQAKFDAVFNELYGKYIPTWLRLFISPESIKLKLQEWYILAKDYLDNGIVDNSQKT